jgi:hypothetical protein
LPCVKAVGLSAQVVGHVSVTTNLDVRLARSSLEEADIAGDSFLLLHNGQHGAQISPEGAFVTSFGKLVLLRFGVFSLMALSLSPFR